MVPQRTFVVSSTTTTAAITTETVVITGTSSTFRAGRAYKLSFKGLPRTTVAGAIVNFQVRDTNVAGTIRGIIGGYPLTATATNYGCYWEHVVANTGALDITTRVLCVTLSATSSSTINAASTAPIVFACEEVGAATDYTEAVAL